jgi:hypothetical protein
MLLGLYRMRAFAQYINSCPQPSYNLFAPAATVVQTADPGSPALTHYGCPAAGFALWDLVGLRFFRAVRVSVLIGRTNHRRRAFISQRTNGLEWQW